MIRNIDRFHGPRIVGRGDNEHDRNDDVRWFWTRVSKRDTAGIVASDRRGDDLGREVDRRWYAYDDVRDRRPRKSDVDNAGTGRQASGKLDKRLCVRGSPFANNCCNVLLCSEGIDVVPGDHSL